MPAPAPRKLFLGVTGASGALYGLRTLQMLVAAGAEVGLCYSDAARRVLAEECGIALAEDPEVLLAEGQDPARVRLYPSADIGAPPASGTALGEAAVLALPAPSIPSPPSPAAGPASWSRAPARWR